MATATRRAIYGKLAGDSTLRGLLGAAAPGFTNSIYHEPAPVLASYPFVTMSKSSGLPTPVFGDAAAGKDIGFETDVWLIKAIDHNTTADKAESIAARLQTLLNDAALSISGATTMYCRRDSDVEYSEMDGGEVYHHVGSLYRVVYD